MSWFDSPTGRPQGRAAALHQGRAQQPTRQPTGRAAALHQGRPTPPPAPSGRAAALHNGGRPTAAANLPATVAAGVSFDSPQIVDTGLATTVIIKVNLRADLYNISSGSVTRLTNAVEQAFRVAVEQTYTPVSATRAINAKKMVYKFVPGQISVKERYDYKNTAGKLELVVVDEMVGVNADGGPLGGLAPQFGTHLYVGKASVASMAKVIVHEIGHTMGLQHTWNDEFVGNDRDPRNVMSYGTIARPKFSGEQLFWSFTKRGSLMKRTNFQVTTKDMESPFGKSTNVRPTRTYIGRGVIIPAPLIQ